MKTKSKKALTTEKYAKKLQALRKSLDAAANMLGMNTLSEIGIRDNEMLSHIIGGIDHLYRGSKVPSDHWPHTPLIERSTNRLNSFFNTHMTCWHVWELLIRTRKDGTLSHSGASKRAFSTGSPTMIYPGVATCTTGKVKTAGFNKLTR